MKIASHRVQQNDKQKHFCLVLVAAFYYYLTRNFAIMFAVHVLGNDWTRQMSIVLTNMYCNQVALYCNRISCIVLIDMSNTRRDISLASNLINVNGSMQSIIKLQWELVYLFSCLFIYSIVYYCILFIYSIIQFKWITMVLHIIWTLYVLQGLLTRCWYFSFVFCF